LRVGVAGEATYDLLRVGPVPGSLRAPVVGSAGAGLEIRGVALEGGADVALGVERLDVDGEPGRAVALDPDLRADLEVLLRLRLAAVAELLGQERRQVLLRGRGRCRGAGRGRITAAADQQGAAREHRDPCGHA